MIAISIAGTGNGLFIAMIGLNRIDDSAHGNAHRSEKLNFLAENFKNLKRHHFRVVMIRVSNTTEFDYF